MFMTPTPNSTHFILNYLTINLIINTINLGFSLNFHIII